MIIGILWAARAVQFLRIPLSMAIDINRATQTTTVVCKTFAETLPLRVYPRSVGIRIASKGALLEQGLRTRVHMTLNFRS
jgi:hypothetical protein